MNRKNLTLIYFPLFIFIVSLLYRVLGLSDNHPFWVDEFSSAIQAQTLVKNGLSSFSDLGYLIEFHNITTHLLITLFFKLYGYSELTARLPFTLIGSLIPVIVYYLTKKLDHTITAVAASLLTSFSYFEITWSRQARGYVLLQLIILLSTALYFNFLSKKKISLNNVLLAFILIIFGVLTHAFYYVFIIAISIHYFLTNRSKLINLVKKPHLYILIIILLLLIIRTRMINVLIDIYKNGIFTSNNIWYYHSFLWREYALISFLSMIGIISFQIMKKKEIQFFVIYIFLHLTFICFFFTPYTSRYLLPIFPYLFVLSSLALSSFSRYSLEKNGIIKYKVLYVSLPIILSLFIILNGDNFVTKPKLFYSVNHDFREIALVDYHQIYSIIKKKGRLNENRTAIIDTWTPRLEWYLGIGYFPEYNFRWINEPGLINGLPKKTDYIVNERGEKELLHSDHILFIGTVEDLVKAVKKYPHGFMIIDDSSLPKEVIDYAKNNFKKELYLEHYPLDDNPYSIWPTTLYSWGID